MTQVLSFIFANKWIAFIVGCLLMLSAGTQYMFSTLAPSLKTELEMTQYDIALVGTFANIGSYTSIGPSIFHDIFGPRATSLLAAIMISTGYMLTFFAVKQWIVVPPFVVGLFFFLMGNGSGAAFVSALSTSMKNFPPVHRGKVVGVLAASFGISSAFFTAIYTYIFQNNLSLFLLFISIVAFSVPMLGVIFLGVREHGKQEQIAKIASEGTDEEKQSLTSANSQPIQNIQQAEQPIEQEEEQKATKLDRFKKALIIALKPPKEGEENYNTFQMICTLDFWLYCAMFFAGIGSGVVVFNNLGSMVISQGGHNGEQSKFVILLSLANCSGRIVFGFVSDSMAKYISRVTFFNMALLGMSMSQFFFAYAIYPLWFYPGIISLGFFYGGLFCLGPSFLSERFGTKYVAINGTVANLSISLSSYLLATKLAATVYQSNVPTYFGEKGKLCLGTHCFKNTFLITTAICVSMVVLGFILMYRTRPMYEARLAKQQKQQDAAAK